MGVQERLIRSLAGSTPQCISYSDHCSASGGCHGQEILVTPCGGPRQEWELSPQGYIAIPVSVPCIAWSNDCQCITVKDMGAAGDTTELWMCGKPGAIEQFAFDKRTGLISVQPQGGPPATDGRCLAVMA